MEYKNGSKKFINREVSWLDFNYRVLDEAKNQSLPVMDRLKFLSITASNLDEFFMVRIAGILDQIEVGYTKSDAAGLAPKEQIGLLSEICHDMVKQQYDCLNHDLFKVMKKHGVDFVSYKHLDDKQKQYLSDYFNEVVFPVITPMAVDNSRPFPLLANNSLNLAVKLMVDEEIKMAVLQVPALLDRYMRLPGDERHYILLEEVIKQNVCELFKGHEVQSVYAFRLTRNGDLAIDEDEAEDLLIEIEKSIKKRKWGAPVRLEYEKKMDSDILDFLTEKLELHEDDLYKIDGPIDPTFWIKFSFEDELSDMRSQAMLPQPAEDFVGYDQNVFEAIRNHDCLMHHPYESFDPVVAFVSQAAVDPSVLAIKQTLYRVSADSPIIKALIRAAENGKQVTVLVELKARFDEENNIIWAKRLEHAGCHVIYGLVGLKIHCKTILVVRREEDQIRRYVHLGTGNYNDSTAKLYTDYGYFTCRDAFGADVSALFNLLTGYAKEPKWKKLAVAPGNLRQFFEKSIDNEIKMAKKGHSAKIIAKMNSLVDETIIEKLYEASEAGVEITLIVRGMCCLRPGVAGQSENIKVYSVVGTFLEHTRIYYFHDGGEGRYYLSSADWMPRNLDRRVETLFPIGAEHLKERLSDMIELTLKDTLKMRIQNPDGSYSRVSKDGKGLESQVEFYRRAKQTAKEKKEALVHLG